MATIALYREAQPLKSGNQYLQPAQFRLADSGVAEGLSKIGDVAENISVKLLQKEKDLNEASTLIHLDNYLSELDLARTKYQTENSSDNQINVDGVNKWEDFARKNADKAMQDWTNRPMSSELRLRVMDRINNYANKSISTAFAQSLSQQGQNFTATLGVLRSDAERTGDFTKYDAALKLAREKGIYSQEQLSAFESDRNDLFYKGEIMRVTTMSKDLVDSAPNQGPQNYEDAKMLWEDLKNTGKIKKEEADFQINQIKYKAQYNDKLKDIELDIQTQPEKVIEAASAPLGTSASLGQIRAQYGQEAMSPEVSQQLFELTEAEVGSQGNDAKVAFMETIFNRAAVTGKTVKQIMDEADRSGKKYYEPYNTGAIGVARASLNSNPAKNIEYSAIMEQVVKGSNLTKGATDNASADVAASVRQGGYDSTPESIVDIGGETFYAKKGRRRLTAAEGEQVLPTGIDLEWATARDRNAIVYQAQQQLAQMGNQQYNRLKDVVNSRIKDPAFDFAAELSTPQFRQLASDPIMKDAATAYYQNQKNIANFNNDANYEKLYAVISAYDPDKDPTKLNAARIGATISANFTGDHESRLKKQLDDIINTTEARATTSITSEALKELNKMTFKDQVFGEYKKPKTVTVEEGARIEKRSLFGIDMLWKDLYGPAQAPVVKKQEIIAKNPLTGAMEKQVDIINVEEEDPELRIQVATTQAAVRQQLEDEVRSKKQIPGLGIIDTRDKAVTRMIQISRLYQKPITEAPKTGVPPATSSAATTAPAAMSASERIKKANATIQGIKQRTQSTGQ